MQSPPLLPLSQSLFMTCRREGDSDESGGRVATSPCSGVPHSLLTSGFPCLIRMGPEPWDMGKGKVSAGWRICAASRVWCTPQPILQWGRRVSLSPGLVRGGYVISCWQTPLGPWGCVAALSHMALQSHHGLQSPPGAPSGSR